MRLKVHSRKRRGRKGQIQGNKGNEEKVVLVRRKTKMMKMKVQVKAMVKTRTTKMKMKMKTMAMQWPESTPRRCLLQLNANAVVLSTNPPESVKKIPLQPSWNLPQSATRRHQLKPLVANVTECTALYRLSLCLSNTVNNRLY